MKLVIKRKDWKRGHIDSSLRTSTGQQCCLGFLAKSAGATNADIFHCSDLSELVNERCDPDGFLAVGPERAAKIKSNQAIKRILSKKNLETKLIDVNDGSEITGKDREKEIKRLFRTVGVRVTFE